MNKILSLLRQNVGISSGGKKEIMYVTYNAFASPRCSPTERSEELCGCEHVVSYWLIFEQGSWVTFPFFLVITHVFLWLPFFPNSGRSKQGGHQVQSRGLECQANE